MERSSGPPVNVGAIGGPASTTTITGSKFANTTFLHVLVLYGGLKFSTGIQQSDLQKRVHFFEASCVLQYLLSVDPISLVRSLPCRLRTVLNLFTLNLHKHTNPPMPKSVYVQIREGEDVSTCLA
jgi:hypothetical protein